MKVFVINLDRNPDRMEFMQNQLDKLGLKFERISAIDGKKLTTKEVEYLYDDEDAKKIEERSLNVGEIGCAASHFGVYKKIVDEDIDYALILEDDTKINSKILKALKKYEKLKHKPDYLLLNWKFFSIINFKNEVRWKLELLKKRKTSFFSFLRMFIGGVSYLIIDQTNFLFYQIFGSFTFPYYRYMDGCMGIIITNKGAKKILSLNKKIFVPIDHIPCKYGKKIKLKKRYLVPTFLSRDKSFGTDIQERYDPTIFQNNK